MLHYLSGRFALLTSVVASLLFSSGAFGIFVTFSKGGNDTPASIQATVDNFRAALGGLNNGNEAGPLGSGRREINWDGGGGVSTTVPAGTPFNVFLNTRGAQFTTPGTGFVQAPPSAFDAQFGLFSPLRIFSPIDSNITDIGFFIPGPNAASQPATVRGFGAVFTDVDLLGSTSIEFFDISNNLIFGPGLAPGQGVVPPGTVSNKSLSFLGALGTAGEEIFRVRITSGNTPSALTFASGVDLVAMDDFIYGEPRAVPESGGIVLMALGLGSVLFFYRPSLAVS